MKHALFISYSRVDSAFALRLVGDLRQRGIDAWLDQLDIPPGANWDSAIENALDQADTVIVVLSAVSAKSENVKNEIGAALERGKQVVPIVLAKGAVPLLINRLQREDFTGEYGAALDKLLHRLAGGSRTASLRAISPEQVQRTAAEAAARLGLSAAGAPLAEPVPDSLAPRSRARTGAAEPTGSRRRLLGGAAGVLLAASLALAFALRGRQEPTSQPTRADVKVAPPPARPLGVSPAPPPLPEAQAVPAAEPSVLPANPGLGSRAEPRASIPRPAAQTSSMRTRSATTSGTTKSTAALALTAPPQVAPQTQAEEPTAEPRAHGYALICVERDFRGACRRTMGQPDFASRAPAWNDIVSSVRLGTCRSVRICSDILFAGRCEVLSADQPNLANTSVGDESLSSIACLGTVDETAAEALGARP